MGLLLIYLHLQSFAVFVPSWGLTFLCFFPPWGHLVFVWFANVIAGLRKFSASCSSEVVKKLPLEISHGWPKIVLKKIVPVKL